MDLQSVFLTLWNMSLTGSIIIGFVLLARLFLRKSPRVFSYVLWAVVLFRLLCPVSVSSVFSVLQLTKAAEPVPQGIVSTMDYTAVEMPDLLPVQEQLPEEEVPVFAEPEYQASPVEDRVIPDDGMELPETPDVEAPQAPAEPVREPIHYAVIIWLVGLGCMTGYNLYSCIRLLQQIEGAVPLRKGLYLADHIPTAFVLGFIRPKIYLPSYLEAEEQGYIVAHERCHIKRKDHVFRFLGYLALCLHWFNPLVWLAFVLSGKDMEMSCDEAVIRMYGPRIRAGYAQSLLRLSTGHRSFALMPLAFGEGDTKERVMNMTKWKKPKLWMSVTALLACVAVLVACAVNPAKETEMPKDVFWDADKDVEQVCIDALDEFLNAQSYYIIHENELDQYDLITEYRRYREDQLILCAMDSGNDRVYQNGKLGIIRGGNWVWQEADMNVDADGWLRTWSPEFVEADSYQAGEDFISFDAVWDHPYNPDRHYEGTITYTFGKDGRLTHARREAVLMEGEVGISGIVDSITPVEESPEDTCAMIQNVAQQCISRDDWEKQDPIYGYQTAKRTSIEVSTVDELLAALGSDASIILSSGTYNLSKASDYGQKTEGKSYFWQKVSDGYELVLREVHNLEIQGPGMNTTTVETDPRFADVFKLENCHDIYFHGFTAGHTRDRGECGGDVIGLIQCHNAELFDLGLFGCGVVGLSTVECRNLIIRNCDIYDCSSSAFQLEYTEGVTVSDCNLYQIGADTDGSYTVFQLSGCEDVVIEGCTVFDNICQTLISAGRSTVTMENCMVKENRFVQGVFLVQGWDMILSRNQFRDNSLRNWYYYSDAKVIDENGNWLTEEKLDEMYGKLTPEPAQAQEEIRVSTVDEFLAAIGPDRQIVIEAESMNISQAEGYGSAAGDYYFWQSAASGGYELVVHNVDNMTIRGADGKDHHLIEAEPRHADVLAFQACSNITVSGITGGHTIEPGGCTGGVLWFRDCDHILVEGCGLFGCGTNGVETEDCADITVKDCDIYECTESGVKMRNTRKIRLENTTFRDIGGRYTIGMINCWDAQQDGDVLIGADAMGTYEFASPEQTMRNLLEMTLLEFESHYWRNEPEEMKVFLSDSYSGDGSTYGQGNQDFLGIHYDVTFDHVREIEETGSTVLEIPYRPYKFDEGEKGDIIRYLLVSVVKEEGRYKISDYELKS